MTKEENEKLVRAFHEATAPGHRESLWGIQAPEVVYDLPEGMPVGCGHFEGLQDVLDRFLTSFYGDLDVRFVVEELIAEPDEIVALGHFQGTTRKAAVPINVPVAHVWTVRDGYLQRLRAFTGTAVLAQALPKEYPFMNPNTNRRVKALITLTATVLLVLRQFSTN